MTTLALVVVTMYSEPYIGGPLFCGGTYTTTTAPWVAAAVGGPFECNERVGVEIDGVIYFVRIGDFGPFGDNCVMQPDGTCPKIVLDFPKMHAPFEGLSAVATKIWSLDKLQARWNQYQ